MVHHLGKQVSRAALCQSVNESESALMGYEWGGGWEGG